MGIHYNTGGGSDLLDYLVDKSASASPTATSAGRPRRGSASTVDEAAVRKAAEVGQRWRNPLWRNTDGSLTEW